MRKRNQVLFTLHILTVALFLSCVELRAAAPVISVTAEGSGVTKIEALKDAWAVAVREAVGMFTAARAELVDDELTERISSYSRGQINSFETLKEENRDGIWTITIRANVDKDIIRENIRPTNSRNLKIEGANLAAAKQSMASKNQDALEVLQTTGLLDFSKCLDYHANLEQFEIDGELTFYLKYVLKIDLKSFHNSGNFLNFALCSKNEQSRNVN